METTKEIRIKLVMDTIIGDRAGVRELAQMIGQHLSAQASYQRTIQDAYDKGYADGKTIGGLSA